MVPVLRTLGTVPYFGEKLMISSGGTALSGGWLVPRSGTRDHVQHYLDGFARSSRSTARRSRRNDLLLDHEVEIRLRRGSAGGFGTGCSSTRSGIRCRARA